MKKFKNRLYIIIFILIILIIFIINIINDKENINNNDNNDLEQSFDFSKYYSEQCPEGEFMISWTEYLDGTIKVDKCVKYFSCPKGEKIVSQCSSLIDNIPCKIYCIGINEVISDW